MVKTLVVVCLCKTDGGVRGGVGLNHYPPGVFVPPGSARYLGEQLERAFRAAVVGYHESRVRGDNADKSNVWKVVSLCDHLRANEKLRFAPRKRAEHLLHGILCTYRIRIHPQRHRVRKQLVKLFFHLLGANAEVLDKRFSALRALRRKRFNRAAEMAAEAVFALVIRHGDIAVVALHNISAGAAGDESGIPASV
ncbi:hypothetical protein SDC9_166522 [bioreactor metagenome]|uniref:Uncharacterized protein n=1 Tax=bioreactor metagenome TaxID=1076179 RepID=A0A645FZ12_9ZZZZ